jgi:hypothetical protein
MTSLLNLLLGSFLAMGAAPAPAAQAATATATATAPQQQTPPAGKNSDAAARAAYKAMLDETAKINEICTRDNFGKACIAAQEQFQRKFLAKVPANHGNGLPR